jgi:hypothetical protein
MRAQRSSISLAVADMFASDLLSWAADLRGGTRAGRDADLELVRPLRPTFNPRCCAQNTAKS